jgi:hypothetical protein
MSPDGRSIVFTHGRSIALVGVDGKEARILAAATIVTESGPGTMSYQEADPTFALSGRVVIAQSRTSGQESGAPPGIAVIDLSALGLLAESQQGKSTGDEKKAGLGDRVETGTGP